MVFKVQPNPLVKVTLEFQDGSELTWKFTKPMNQFDVFAEIGKLVGKYGLGNDLVLPKPEVSKQ